MMMMMLFLRCWTTVSSKRRQRNHLPRRLLAYAFEETKVEAALMNMMHSLSLLSLKKSSLNTKIHFVFVVVLLLRSSSSSTSTTTMKRVWGFLKQTLKRRLLFARWILRKRRSSFPKRNNAFVLRGCVFLFSLSKWGERILSFFTHFFTSFSQTKFPHFHSKSQITTRVIIGTWSPLHLQFLHLLLVSLLSRRRGGAITQPLPFAPPQSHPPQNPLRICFLFLRLFEGRESNY